MPRAKTAQLATKRDLKTLTTTLRSEIRQSVQRTDKRLKKVEGDLAILKSDVKSLKDDVRILKNDTQALKKDVQNVKDDIKGLRDTVQEMKGDIVTLKLDYQEMRMIQSEILQELRLLRDSVQVLNQRVVYQRDLPERVEQLEHDTHTLKLEIHRLTKAQ